MKRILLFVTASAASLGMYAQTIVGTAPTDRNVVLEDLTGIYCGYCPDGALKADQLAAAAPGRVVIIGNHAGSYANPQPGQANHLDMRTQEGTAVNSLSKPTGYPTGNINRVVTSNANTPGGTAMYRNHWANVASALMLEPSPLNLAVEAYYYEGTNKVMIKVEGYYTSASDGDDYLTVAVLQDEIDTYQSGAAGYPARVQPSGLYRQMDVLRGYLTAPVTGEKVSASAANSLVEWSTEYTPVNVGPDVIADIENLKIAVWMTEDAGWSPIITAAEAHVMSRPVGINEATSLNGLNIYPNPFRDNATVEFNLESSQQIAVNFFDVTGKVVQSVPSTVYNAGNHKVNLDGTNLQAGVYYVNIVAEDGITTRKLVLNK